MHQQQQLPEAADYIRDRIERAGKCNNNRLDVTDTFWAGMLYSILVVSSVKIMGKFREIEKRFTEFIFFERRI